MVNLEVKGQLAKLLATEDIIVEHRNVATASFDVDGRVLTLPRWEDAPSEVFDLLIAHEVGHALFTPPDDWNDIIEVPGIYVNIAEDVRIERMIKGRFGGLPKTFYNGYKILYEQDFFDIDETDISTMSIADRANLHFKIGHFIMVPFFSQEERDVIKQIADADTFEEMVYAASALHRLHNEQLNSQPSPEVPTNSGDGEDDVNESDDEQGDDIENNSNGDGTEDSNSGETEEDTIEQPSQNGGDTSLDDDIRTVDNLSSNIESLAKKSSFNEPKYIEIPDVDLDRVCVSNSDVHGYIRDYWNKTVNGILHDPNNRRTRPEIEDLFFKYPRLNYQNFKRDVQSEVNYMVKEFECKKSAAAYARASTSRTGILDCTKLHTYKYNEDLFKKITTLPNGKNHGLVFILDWSGSMSPILDDTVRQLLSVVMFCDKVNIPFDVYTFTNEWSEDYHSKKGMDKENIFYIGPDFSMLNVLSSRTSRKELGRQMETLYTLAVMYTYSHGGGVPPKMGLSGTPLNEAIMTLKMLLPDFKARTGVDKAHVMILTDGESNQTRYVRSYENYQGETELGIGRIFVSGNYYIRNRSTGCISWIGTKGNSVAPVSTFILNDLQAMFPESTFTGFRILENNSSYFIRAATDYDDKLISQWKKTKSIALTNFGYDKYFIIGDKHLKQSTEFDVDDDATKAKIKTAFAKSLKGKKVNKRILCDFIDLIA